MSYRFKCNVFSCIGFVACTATNPIWFVKTRLQLDSNGKQSTLDTIRTIYRQSGIKGFYKGMTASYMGISETVIHFVIYEAVKKRLQDWSHSGRSLADEEKDEKSTSDFFQFMIAGALSKTVATCIAYPHGNVFSFLVNSISCSRLVVVNTMLEHGSMNPYLCSM